jgi:hypothetical protein
MSFHALPEETWRWIQAGVIKYKIKAYGHKTLPLSVAELNDKTENEQRCFRKCLLSIKPLRLTEDLRMGSIDDLNPGTFEIDIGVHKPGELGESFARVRDDNAERLKIWKALMSDWKKNTELGVYAMDPVTKATCRPSRTHRISLGAKAMLGEGGILRSMGRAIYIMVNR